MGDENVWVMPYGALEVPQPAYFRSAAVPRGSLATPSEASTDVDPYGSVNTRHQVNPQGFLPPMIYPAFVNSTENHDLGVHRAGTTSEQPGSAQFFTQSLTNGPAPIDQPMNATAPMGGVGLFDAGPMVSFYNSDTPPGVDMRVGDAPGRDGMYISFPLTRRTKTGRRAPVRSPPRTVEANVDVLCTRLLAEGADIEAVEIIRKVIFATVVNEEALMAPITTYEKWSEYNGATRVWQLLLVAKEAMPGETSYCCRLCPETRRPEYKHKRDAVRHFKKDHFGFAEACIYW